VGKNSRTTGISEK